MSPSRIRPTSRIVSLIAIGTDRLWRFTPAEPLFHSSLTMQELLLRSRSVRMAVGSCRMPGHFGVCSGGIGKVWTEKVDKLILAARGRIPEQFARLVENPHIADLVRMTMEIRKDPRSNPPEAQFAISFPRPRSASAAYGWEGLP